MTSADVWASATSKAKQNLPRSQSSSAISDVTSPVKLVGKICAIALGSKPPLVTRIARTDVGTRLRQSVFFSSVNKTKGGSARRVKDAKVFLDFSSYPGSFFYTIYYIKAKNYNIKQLLIILLKDTKSYGGRKERYSTVG